MLPKRRTITNERNTGRSSISRDIWSASMAFGLSLAATSPRRVDTGSTP
jgi:hypothetical protein